MKGQADRFRFDFGPISRTLGKSGDYLGFASLPVHEAVTALLGARNPDEFVAWLNDHNKKVQERDDNGNIITRRRVKIYTFLYRGQDPRAMDVMKKIAAEHDGKFTHVIQE